nr:hypothetical protein Iba_chr13dCG5550 [Ipomoea batatas]
MGVSDVCCRYCEAVVRCNCLVCFPECSQWCDVYVVLYGAIVAFSYRKLALSAVLYHAGYDVSVSFSGVGWKDGGMEMEWMSINEDGIPKCQSHKGEGLEHYGPGGRELIHGATPASHSHPLHGLGYGGPRLVGGGRDRHGHRPRPENLHHLPQHLGNVTAIIVTHALEARVAEPVLRGHVDGGVTLAVDAIHGVAAGIKREIANCGIRVYLPDSGEVRHVSPDGGLAGREEVAGEEEVELGHANFDGVRDIIIIYVHIPRIIGGGEDMPRMRGELRVHEGGFGVTKMSGQLLFQVQNLFLETGVRVRLGFRENEVATGVPTMGCGEAQSGCKVDQRTDGFQ